MGSENGVLQRFVRMVPLVPYQVPVHRGPRLVDQWAIMGRLPLDKWFIGPSQLTEERKSGDVFAIETFGMLEKTRLTTGDCAGASNFEEALAVLASRVKWSDRIVDLFRAVGRTQVQAQKRCVVAYNQMHEHLVYLSNGEGSVGNLVGLVANIWQIAYAATPGSNVTPLLVRMLILLGLNADAVALKNKFTI